ncbi:hypothetical protein AALO_G00022220 [Alosa alosa]|uniref:RBR-type E3 ubiquitin transferase n=1 Tax=Alosa alosa TaxID=278164 RepID=A0AAV6H9G0_9TELE|nr:hypothetical protein AALO_G00022220 [Alosa alosa]
MASALAGNRLMTSVASKQTQCPRCLQPDGRVVDGHRSVCQRCSKSLRRVYQFCWACRREWPRTGSQAQGHACTLPNCALRAALLSEERIIDPKSAAFSCPFFRACPNCKELMTHNGVGCRCITCTKCYTEFCFHCLRKQYCSSTNKTCFIVDNSAALQSL